MNLQIRDSETKPGHEVGLYLEMGSYGVLVRATLDGEVVACNRLISVQPSGKIRRCVDVNPALGFDLDGDGRIKFTDED